MFFPLFSNLPILPRGWDSRHLWAAQCVIFSVIEAEREWFRAIEDADEMFRQMKNDYDEWVYTVENPRLFPNDEFRQCVLAGLDEYAQDESASVIAFLKGSGSAPVQPNQTIIMETIKNNRDFSDHIRKGVGTP
jgi:hypothetical protein